MLKKIIISRGRSKTITTHKLLSDFIVLCPESEKELYEQIVTNVETIPDKIVGLAGVRNWTIQNYKEDVLFIDDDITGFFSVCGTKAMRIKDPQAVDQILNNLYINAKDVGARVFGLNQTADPRKYTPNQPFKLKGWLGSVIGVIGKDLKFDERNKIRVDVDFCLQSLMHDRLIWVDNRFAFFSKKNLNTGGNSKMRSERNLEKEKTYLKNKWGKYINFYDGKETDNVKIIVSREDNLTIG